MNDEPADIIHVHPGHPLLARAQTSAKPETKDRPDALKRTTIRSQNEAGPEKGDPNLVRLRGQGGLLPFRGNIGQETFPARSGLGEHFISSVTVEAGRRSADQNANFASGKSADEGLRDLDPTLANALPFLLRPPADDRLTGEIHDRVERAQIRSGISR